jgi:hypothetical protein
VGIASPLNNRVAPYVEPTIWYRLAHEHWDGVEG